MAELFCGSSACDRRFLILFLVGVRPVAEHFLRPMGLRPIFFLIFGCFLLSEAVGLGPTGLTTLLLFSLLTQ